MNKIKTGKSIGIILPGTEMRSIKYEEVRDAIDNLQGYRKTLKRLGKKPPKHIKICLKILSLIEPMYHVFHPRGG